MGDHNDIINLAERNHGGIEMLRRCHRFKHWIENNGFIDLGFYGHQYTWVRDNNESTQKCERLDRALCNAKWRTRFQEGEVQHLLQNYSDHLLLLVTHEALPSFHANQNRFGSRWHGLPMKDLSVPYRRTHATKRQSFLNCNPCWVH